MSISDNSKEVSPANKSLYGLYEREGEKESPKSSHGFNVTFMPTGRKVFVEEGENLLSAARRADVPLIADCNGLGVCGRCRLKILEGDVIREETSDGDDENFIIACKSFPAKDTVLEVPDLSLPEGIRQEPVYSLEKRRVPYKNRPIVEKIKVTCQPADADGGITPLDSLCSALRARTGIKDYTLKPAALRKLTSLTSEGEDRLTVTLCLESNPAEIIEISGDEDREITYGIAVDLGTTTVEALLSEIPSGRVLGRISLYNPQNRYGRSITSRLNFAANHKGLLLLNDVINDGINDLFVDLVYSAGISKDEVTSVVFSGNNVMTNLFLGLDTELIRKPPNVPAALKFPLFKAKDLNLYANADAYVFFSPGAGAYVGGDLISSLVATGMPEGSFVMADIGTNGEAAVVIDGVVLCASASAGSAFEGGSIKKGMSAVPGAISRVYFSKTHGDFVAATIENEKPKGISGTGLIDLIAVLMEKGYVDKKGRFRNRDKTSRIRRVKGVEEFILTYSSKEEEIISVTEDDVQYILQTKGAIYTTCRFLLKNADMEEEDIDKFFVAGTLGKMINVENAVTIGLLPDIEREKYDFIGNGSLLGAWMMLISEDARKKAEEIVQNCAYFELSREPEFMNSYTSSLFLPHTELDRFKSVIRKLEEGV